MIRYLESNFEESKEEMCLDSLVLMPDRDMWSGLFCCEEQVPFGADLTNAILSQPARTVRHLICFQSGVPCLTQAELPRHIRAQRRSN